MVAGDLRHRVTIQAPPLTADAIRGVATGSPTTVAEKVPVKIEPLDGRELVQAQQVAAHVTHRITMRYRAGVTPTQRIVFGTRTYHVIAVLNLEERNRWLRLLCVELA